MEVVEEGECVGEVGDAAVLLGEVFEVEEGLGVEGFGVGESYEVCEVVLEFGLGPSGGFGCWGSGSGWSVWVSFACSGFCRFGCSVEGGEEFVAGCSDLWVAFVCFAFEEGLVFFVVAEDSSGFGGAGVGEVGECFGSVPGLFGCCWLAH